MDVGVGLWTMRATARRPASHPQLYAELVQDGLLAEELGYHSLWVAEHHFWYDAWCPAPLVAAAAVLGGTSRLRVGTGIALLPLWESTAVVEQVAGVADLAGGRLDLGVGLGYRDAEFDGFGLARRDRGRRMEVALQALAQRRDQGVSTPPVWVGGMAPAAIERAVRHGHGVLLPQTLTVKQVRAALELVRQTAAAADRPAPRAAVLRHGWVTAGGQDEARLARAAVASTMREYIGAWFPLKGRPGFSVPEALERQVARAVDAALIGTAEEMTAGLAELADAGVDLAVLHLTSDGARVDYRGQMGTISEHVLPALSGVSA
jgi:alkanesulfonate monooxygenase SsuD/methylene tetrahydromethanopterin reductase-like flavin-dependent oxidoreductase (luciferase family)